MVVPNDWITEAATQSAPGTCGLCSDLVNGTISGPGIASATITDFLGVGYGPLGVTPNVATFRISGSPQLVGAQIPGKTLILTPTAGLNAAALVGQKVAGDGIPDGTVITAVLGTRLSGEIVYSVSQDVLVGKGNTVTTPDYYPNGKDSFWVELHDAGWGNERKDIGQVNQIVPFENTSIGNGVVVGLNNGSVQLWDGTLSSTSGGSVTGQTHWLELHDAGWGSGVTTIALAKVNATDASGVAGPQDGVVVGLANGATEQWTGVITGRTGQNDWLELAGFYAVNYAAQILNAGYKSFGCATDGLKCFQGSNTLKKAVEFGAALAQTIQSNILYPPQWGTAGGVGGPLDPLFGPQNPDLREGAAAHGTYHPFAINGLFNDGKASDFGKLISGTDFFKKLQVVYPDPLSMKGEILPADQALKFGLIPADQTATPCGQAGKSSCSVLIAGAVKNSQAQQQSIVGQDVTIDCDGGTGLCPQVSYAVTAGTVCSLVITTYGGDDGGFPAPLPLPQVFYAGGPGGFTSAPPTVGGDGYAGGKGGAGGDAGLLWGHGGQGGTGGNGGAASGAGTFGGMGGTGGVGGRGGLFGLLFPGAQGGTGVNGVDG